MQDNFETYRPTVFEQLCRTVSDIHWFKKINKDLVTAVDAPRYVANAIMQPDLNMPTVKRVIKLHLSSTVNELQYTCLLYTSRCV